MYANLLPLLMLTIIHTYVRGHRVSTVYRNLKQSDMGLRLFGKDYKLFV